MCSQSRRRTVITHDKPRIQAREKISPRGHEVIKLALLTPAAVVEHVSVIAGRFDALVRVDLSLGRWVNGHFAGVENFFGRTDFSRDHSDIVPALPQGTSNWNDWPQMSEPATKFPAERDSVRISGRFRHDVSLIDAKSKQRTQEKILDTTC